MYRKWIHLHGPNGEKVRMQAVIDGGAMRNTMCTSKWHAQRHRLAPLTPSKIILSVADNRHIASKGKWTGTVDVAGTEARQSFEVFDSNGAFQVILGKPWLSYVQAVHRYGTDQITIQAQGLTKTISNDNEAQEKGPGHAPGRKNELQQGSRDPKPTEAQRKWREKRAEAQRDARMTGGSDNMTPQHGEGARPPSSDTKARTAAKNARPKRTGQPVNPLHHVQQGRNGPDQERAQTRTASADGWDDPRPRDRHGLANNPGPKDGPRQSDDPGRRANEGSQRAKDPASPERVQAILEKVSIGPDLSDEERNAVTDLLKEYPDIFALNLSEVFPVDFAQHRLNIDPHTVLPKKVHQRPITEPQRKFFTDIINDMETAGVIKAVPAEFIKCLNATNLAPKEAGKNLGMSRDALLRRCNEQCRRYGLPDYWEQTEKDAEKETSDLMTPVTDDEPKTPPKKWRVCQAFHAVNAMTQIPAFPSGDLKAKQQKVVGK